jgi:hypothetical protein
MTNWAEIYTKQAQHPSDTGLYDPADEHYASGVSRTTSHLLFEIAANRNRKMTRLLNVVAATLLIVSVGVSARAQEVTSESLAASRELMALTNKTASLDNLISAMAPQVAQFLEKANPGKEALIQSTVEELLLPEIRKSIPDAIDEVAHIYAHTFTQEELDEVIAFVKSPAGQTKDVLTQEEANALMAFHDSPVGQKFLERSPDLLREVISAAQIWGQRAASKALHDFSPVLRERGIQVPI